MVDRIIAQEADATSGKISFEEYLRLYDGQFAEWIDGEVILLVSTSQLQQEILGFLYVLLSAYLNARPLGKLFMAPFAMKLPDKRHGREPDLLFVSVAHANRLKESYVDGAADLAIEIISPESIERDTVDKFAEYEAGGVTEYLLIDLDKREARLNRLGSDQKYHLVLAESDGTLRSEAIPGFRLATALIWQEPLPTVQQTVALVDAMIRDSE